MARKTSSAPSVTRREPRDRLPPTALRRTRPRAYEEWKALREWGRLPPWEPARAGFVLRAARESAGLTQIELARRLDVTQQAVARAERSDSNPTTALLDEWARAVGGALRLEITSGPGEPPA
jgi:DNA-binding XRE family transcriptional regulator